MRILASPRIRLFLACWVIYSLHFATNVVREHYPAFALVEKGTFRVDEYEGFHSDIFRHTDGHCYIGNQVAASVVAAIPLLVFDPLLDWLEERSKARLAGDADGGVGVEYSTEYPNRQRFMRLVRSRGLELRFGAATAITSVFLMAPLSALAVIFIHSILARRLRSERGAMLLALLFGFGTPVFYRAAHLNHNVMLMLTVFGTFLCLWNPRGVPEEPLRFARRFAAGFLAGCSLALDYAGVVPLLVFYVWLIARRVRTGGWKTAIVESLAYVAGSVPPVMFLLWSQWVMYGDPFLPGQYWMPEVNYTDEGWRGFSLPRAGTFWANLVDPNYGLLAFAPFMALGFVPARVLKGELVFPAFARRASVAFMAAFLVFCAANQYSLMQWNSGFRYLLPVVPFLFLHAADILIRLPKSVLGVIAVGSILHQWVLSMARFTPVDFGDPRSAVGESWRRFFDGGVQLPWLTVLRQTTAPGSFVHHPVIPYALIGLAIFIIWVIVRLGRRAAA